MAAPGLRHRTRAVRVARILSVSLILAAGLNSRLFAQDAVSPAESRIVVSATPPASEDSLIGPNQQPVWTASRRFLTTRVYVLPPWQFEFEQWWNGKFPKEGTSEHLFQSELEVGLPYRFQLDVYDNVEHAGGTTRHSGNQVEVRWGLAEWGRIPLNPTFYVEGKFNDSAPDAYEIKLLLGQELAPRWHWGANLFYEQETGGSRKTEWGFSQAVSYTVLERKLSVGVEMNFENTTERGSRGKPAVEFLIGPSVQWRPSRHTYLDIVPLIGTTHDSPYLEPFLVFGVELGGGPADAERAAPVSAAAR